jgi:hypothetical protein
VLLRKRFTATALPLGEIARAGNRRIRQQRTEVNATHCSAGNFQPRCIASRRPVAHARIRQPTYAAETRLGDVVRKAYLTLYRSGSHHGTFVPYQHLGGTVDVERLIRRCFGACAPNA